MRDRIAREFAEKYGRPPQLVIRSPGRVNLIGDHTDYNDGFVMPIAIDQATWIAAAPREDRSVDITSIELGTARFDLDRLETSRTWADYVAGTLSELGLDLEHGFDAVVRTDIPVGAGLSSSAALELGIARLAAELGRVPWDPIAAALAAQRAENEFVGMPCGIMDQLIVAGGVRGHALLLDCRSLDTHKVFVPATATIVILDTGTRRRLVESAYEDRRNACERAAAALGVPALRDATLGMLDSASLDPVMRRRARHVITENARTQEAARALAGGDLESFGCLMDESHVSLRDDFKVSGTALDAITDIARRHPGCLGARVTGGGFAGCAVALVDTPEVEAFVNDVGPAYDAATGNSSALYPTPAAAGVALV